MGVITRRALAVGTPSERRCCLMLLTVTFHIFGYTVTIKVKKQNRHPAR